MQSDTCVRYWPCATPRREEDEEAAYNRIVNALHRIRTPLILVNALLTILFGLAALAAPEPFWGLVGVEVEAIGVLRLAGWYLFVFGVGGLLIARHPERHPVVVALIGIEKVGPAVLFPLLYAQGDANVLLALAGAGDALLAVVFVGYAWWLGNRRGP